VVEQNAAKNYEASQVSNSISNDPNRVNMLSIIAGEYFFLDFMLPLVYEH
jgi:hypothetical protein